MRVLISLIILVSPQVWAISAQDVQRDPSVLLQASKAELETLAAKVGKTAGEKLKNFASVKQHLDDCFANNQDERGLKRTILAGGLSNPCLSGGFGYAKPTDVIFDLSEVAGVANFAEAKKIIAERALSNSARAVYDYRAQFEGAKPLPDADDSGAMSKLAKQICPSCSADQQSYFKKAFAQQMKTGQSGPSKYSIDSLIYQQNQTLEGLNFSVEKMEAAKNNKNEAAFNEAYDKYLDDYQRFASTPAGALFLTDEIRGAVGRAITPAAASKQFLLVGATTFPRHKLLDKTITCINKAVCNPRERTRMKKALYEIEDKIADFTQKTLKANSFTELLKVDPALAGQILVLNPGLIGEVCSAIHAIAIADADMKTALGTVEAVVDAADVAAMGLMVTGVGGVMGKGITTVSRLGLKAASHALIGNLKTSAGRTLVSNAMGESVIARTTASRLMARSTALGAAGEAGHLLHDGGKLVQLSGYRDVLVASRMARATDELDIKRLTDLETKWSDSLDKLVKGTAWNALPLAHGLMKVRSSKFFSSFLKGKTDLPSELAADQKVMEMVNSLGSDGGQLIAKAIKEGQLDADGVAGALVAASQIEGGPAKLLKGLKENASELLKELSLAGKQAMSCAI